MPSNAADPQAQTSTGLELLLRQRQPQQALRLFAYGSLIWKPEFDFRTAQAARVHGYHRCLRMRSQLYRGTEHQPGLVLALISGGSCEGVLYDIAPEHADTVLRQVWAREMISGAYTPRWLACRGRDGGHLGQALAFTLQRRSPNLVGPLAEDELLRVFRHARGRYGSTLDYLQQTVHSLRAHGIRDRELERQYGLALRHQLCEAPAEHKPRQPAPLA
jgi:cation transport protein ChaC